MVIDFHTHVFPDKLAHKTINMLSERAKIKAYSMGDVLTTVKSMDDAGIALSVALSIATNAKQNENVNSFAIELDKHERFVAFGSVHPEADWKYQLDRLADCGIKGIKLHPDYQGFFVDDKKMLPIYEYILKKGFILSFHSGLDLGLPEPVHCTPLRIKNTLSVFSGEKVVFAHMGSMADFNGCAEHLFGKDVYIDTSVFPFYMPSEKYKQAILAHPIDKILFASDLPWSNQKESINELLKLKLDKEKNKKILYKNAEKLLNLRDGD